MYCIKCGTEINQNIKYCPNCGEKVNLADNNAQSISKNNNMGLNNNNTTAKYENQIFLIITSLIITILFFGDWVTVPFIGWFDTETSNVSIKDVSKIIDFLQSFSQNFMQVADDYTIDYIKFALYCFYVIPISNVLFIISCIIRTPYAKITAKVSSIITAILSAQFIIAIICFEAYVKNELGRSANGLITLTFVPYAILGLSILSICKIYSE